MYIELITEESQDNWINAGSPPIIYGPEFKAFLKFYVGPFTCSYYGSDRDSGDAVLMAIQNFLSGERSGRDVASERNGIGLGWENGIVFDPKIHPEIKTIIEQAIDLKTGNDRNKLMSVFQ